MSVLVWVSLAVLALGALALAAAYLQLIAQSGRVSLRLEELERAARQPGFGPRSPESSAAGDGDHLRNADLDRGFRAGADAPSFTLPDSRGHRHHLGTWLGERILLVFLSAETEYGRDTWRALAAAATYRRPGWPRLILVDLTPDESRAFAETVDDSPLIVLRDTGAVAREYFVDLTPVAFLIDERGKLVRSRIAGVQPIVAAAGEPPTDAGSPLRGRRAVVLGGNPAPAFELPALRGGSILLEAFRGSPVLLLFVDPGCAASRAVVARLDDWTWRDAKTTLIVVSRGAEAPNRAWFAAHPAVERIALQHDWEVSRLYGMLGTPVAVLIEEDGIVAGEPKAGAGDVGVLLASLAADG